MALLARFRESLFTSRLRHALFQTIGQAAEGAAERDRHLVHPRCGAVLEVAGLTLAVGVVVRTGGDDVGSVVTAEVELATRPLEEDLLELLEVTLEFRGQGHPRTGSAVVAVVGPVGHLSELGAEAAALRVGGDAVGLLLGVAPHAADDEGGSCHHAGGHDEGNSALHERLLLDVCALIG